MLCIGSLFLLSSLTAHLASATPVPRNWFYCLDPLKTIHCLHAGTTAEDARLIADSRFPNPDDRELYRSFFECVWSGLATARMGTQMAEAALTEPVAKDPAEKTKIPLANWAIGRDIGNRFATVWWNPFGVADKDRLAISNGCLAAVRDGRLIVRGSANDPTLDQNANVPEKGSSSTSTE
jgi:hypothetical protein